jgi:GTPase SAR1 family protein
VQLLTGGGASWDATCDEMIAAGKACEEAPAIRVCISMWARERAEGRPLTDVEIETIRRGRSSVETYFSERTKSRTAIYRRKICVVGTSKAGKTSLIKSLTTKLPQLEHADDRTIGIDQFRLRLSEPVHGTSATTHEVTFWDFAGQDAYHVAHSLFFSARTLFLVCVDLEAYQTAYMQADLMCDTKAQHEQLMNEFIERIVLRWVRVIFARQPDAEFVFLSTKDDLLRGFPRFTKEIKAFLKVKLSQVQGIVDVMKRQNGQKPAQGGRPAETLTLHAFSKYPRSANEEKSTWSGYSRPGRTQKPSKLNDGTSIFVSCTDVESVAASRQAIEAVVLSSGRSFFMPDSYSLVLNAIIDMREAAACAPARERIAKAFVPVSTLLRSLKLVVANVNHRDVLQILHDLGDILWYEDLGVELFAETVILDPMLLIDFVRQVINHEVSDELLEHRELVVKPFWRSLADEAQLLAMKQMLEKFQLVHASAGAMAWDSDLIVPAIWKSKQPAAWLFGGEEVRLGSDATADDEDVRVYWEFCFPYEFPDTLFDHLVVASYSPYYTRHAGPDWIVYEEPLVFNCRIMVSRDGKSMQRMLRLEAVLAKGADTDATNELWEIFQLLCMSLRQVLREYPGVLLTSYALDDTLAKRMRLESLFQIPVSARSRKWMPRADVWEWYKALITHMDS